MAACVEFLLMDEPMNLGLEAGVIVSIPVRDIRKSCAWYSRTFGFEIVRTLDDPAWCELATPTEGMSVGLAQVERGDGGDTTPIFTVGSIEAAAAALAAEHIAASKVVTVDGHAKLLTLQDPDGNTLMLQEKL